MDISYKRLWKLLIDRDMKKQDLCEKAGVSTSSLAKLGRGENVNTAILVKICRALDCGIDDIMEIVPDTELKTKHKKYSSGGGSLHTQTIQDTIVTEFEDNETETSRNPAKVRKSSKSGLAGTFQLNHGEAIHSWYSYIEGYSSCFVEDIIDELSSENIRTVYDPFGGTGTTPLVASKRGMQPFIANQTLLCSL